MTSLMIKRFKAISFLALMTLIFGDFLAIPAAAPAAPRVPWDSKVDPWVLETAAAGETEFIIFLTQQADLSDAATLQTKLEKGTYVFERLTEIAGHTQEPLIAALDAMGATYRPYWVANMIWVRGDMQVIQSLATRADVAHLSANPEVYLELPATEPPFLSTLAPGAPETIEWNILQVNADDVWAAGYTGQDAVIGGQDTGYDWDHPALKDKYRGWDGASANHNYHWHDAIHSGGGICGHDSPQPCDDGDHGTHTMGTMVGDDGDTKQIGMAPGAQWIGCRNMDRNVGTPITYFECYQWFIAPTDLNNENPRPDLAPDVINNSWSCPTYEGCTDPNVLLSVVENVRAAGILTAHSAGNGGYAGCSTVNAPAAIYDASFTVGATDGNDTIAGFSSRGPVSVDGSFRLKPNVSAPGYAPLGGILSSVPGGGYDKKYGTSMAAPHVAGLVALLISAQPALRGQVDALENLIEASAVPFTTTENCGSIPGSQVPNNTYGWGRIDAWSAYSTHVLEVEKKASTLQIIPGDFLTYTITVEHTAITSTNNIVITDTLPLNSTFITATLPHDFDGATVRWSFPSLDANEMRNVELAVRVPVTYTGVIVNERYGAVSDDIPEPVLGEPVTTKVGYFFHLPMISKEP